MEFVMRQKTHSATRSVDQRRQRHFRVLSRVASAVATALRSLRFHRASLVNLLLLLLAACLISVFYLEELSMTSPTKVKIVGPLVSDRIVRSGDKPLVGLGSKIDCRIEDQAAGLLANAAGAFCDVANKEPELLAIVGPDRLAKYLADDLNARFNSVQFVATADRTRASCIVPSSSGPVEAQQIFTMRSKINQEATIAALDGLLDDCSHLLVGSMTAADDALVNYVLGWMNRQPGNQSYLVLTGSQLQYPRRATQLANKANWVQVNAAELQKWTGVSGDVVSGIHRLREWGLGPYTSIIVTDGANGVYWYTNEGWGHQRAFQVSPQSDLAAGDTLTGTVLAGIAAGHDFREAIRLGAAAAAMKVGGLRRRGGWDGLRDFAANTPLLPIRPKRPIRRPMFPSNGFKIAGAAAVAAVMVGITIWKLMMAAT